MPQTLADVVFRRTDLATGGYPGRAVMEECASMMAGALGWDQDRINKEIEAVEAAIALHPKAHNYRFGVNPDRLDIYERVGPMPGTW